MPGIRAGRDQFQEVVQRYYAKTRGQQNYKVASYADFRELLEKEKDIDAVKIMTPDHLHAAIGIAAMKKGKAVAVHKPLANRMNEAKLIMETARQTKVATHFLAWGRERRREAIVARIKEGVIGPLREVHNWTDRPVWPQYTELPTDRPPVPEGFDWQLWLGPERDRPYHPCYTHMVFRSWYDFGGGCIADVGIYSLWPVFTALNLGPPISARAWSTHTCNTVDSVANPVENDFAFPTACVIQFQYAARADMPALDVFWYDGGMQPRIPELDADPAPLAPGGMLWVGDKGKILTGGRGGGTTDYRERGRTPVSGGGSGAGRQTRGPEPGNELRPRGDLWVPAIKGGAPSPGEFPERRADFGDRLPGRRGIASGASEKRCSSLSRADQAAVRQREHEDHQSSRREQVSDSRLSAGLGAVGSTYDCARPIGFQTWFYHLRSSRRRRGGAA